MSHTPAIKRLSCAALGVLLGAAPLCAGNFSSSAVGTSSGKFLSFGSSARAAGMGEAYCAVTQAADSVRYNPAALVRVEANSAEVMHSNYLADTFLDYGAYARRLGPNQALGLSALQMTYGSVDETDETGYKTGTAHPSNLALTGAYAHKFYSPGGLLDGSAAGLSVSYVQSTIVSSAKTFTASLGLLSPAYGPYETQLAFVAENLIGSLKFDQKAGALPMTFKLGAIMHIKQDWLLALDLVGPKDNAAYAALGTEKTFTTRSEMKLAARAGYNLRFARDLDGLAGFAAGLGLAFNKLAFDYALTPFGELGYTHKLSLAFKFGAAPGERYAEEKRPAKAVQDLELEVADELEAEPSEPADQCQGCLAPADKYFAQKDYKSAALEYKRSLGLLSGTDSRLIYVYERQGQIELKGRNIPKARDFFLAAIQTGKKLKVSDTNVVNAYLGLAYCFEKNGNTDAAIKNYERAMELSASPATKTRIKTILRKLDPDYR
jgi:tetratricopeptide (TPR) repeat protein